MEKINQLEKLSDKSFRTQLRKDPKKHIAELFSNNDTQDVEIVVKTNTKNMMYVVFPNSNSDIDLSSVQAATAFGTASTVASAGSLSSTVSTVSTGGTASTL